MLVDAGRQLRVMSGYMRAKPSFLAGGRQQARQSASAQASLATPTIGTDEQVDAHGTNHGHPDVTIPSIRTAAAAERLTEPAE